MIIVKLLGGLGNQMFQYAAATALAKKHQVEIRVDISAFESYDLRNFELDKLRISALIATESEIGEKKAKNLWQRFKASMSSHRHKKFYKEPFFHFDDDFQNLGKDVYLQGYFQSEKYFLPVNEDIRKAFVFKNNFSDTTHAVANTLQNTNSVSLHIRRGDYSNAEALHVHGVLPITYYQTAIAYIKQFLPDSQFYIFSDEPEVAFKELAMPEVKIISGRRTGNHYEDFFLMQQCRHNIVANSSFSWWAAWLNNNPEKKVIAPKRWFANGPKDTQDLLPPNWIRL